jgi:hypothetical protein
MDAIWYGLQAFFEFIFELAKPIGRGVNFLFILFGFVGTFYWLWYDKHVEKGNSNFMSDPVEKKD